MIAPLQPALLPSAVHVWTLALPSLRPHLPSPEDLLSTDELERSQRLRFDKDRERFVVTRQALRILLGGYLRTDPRNLSFDYLRNGKPRLAKPNSDIRFNVSHSHEYGMVAIARNQEVGVDLEFQGRDVEIEDLAHRFFSSYEQAQLTEIPPDRRVPAFFQLWTAKEALIKAMGVGLSLPLDSFDVGLDPVLGSRLIAIRRNTEGTPQWRVQTVDAPNGYAAALASDGHPQPPQMLVWQP